MRKKRLKDLKKLDFVEEVRKPGIARAMLSSAASEIGIIELLNKEVYGENTIISLIDSGVDLLDPDIAYYVRSAEDFTGEGFYDFLGHGRIIARILRILAPGSSLLNAKVLNRNNEANELDIMQAIDWSVRIHNTDVINLSIGISRNCDGSCPLCETVNAVNEFAIVVAAAGNESPALNTINCPGNASKAITVGACEGDKILDFSSRGSKSKDKPNLVAPGVINLGGLNIRGTSIATLIVSSTFALLLSNSGDKDRCLEVIKHTCKDLGYKKYEQGRGKIQANKGYDILE